MPPAQQVRYVLGQDWGLLITDDRRWQEYIAQNNQPQVDSLLQYQSGLPSCLLSHQCLKDGTVYSSEVPDERSSQLAALPLVLPPTHDALHATEALKIVSDPWVEEELERLFKLAKPHVQAYRDRGGKRLDMSYPVIRSWLPDQGFSSTKKGASKMLQRLWPKLDAEYQRLDLMVEPDMLDSWQ